MNILNPLGFLALLGIPAVIAMYLLKQKYEQKEISSIELWMQALTLTKSQKPWQKLKKNILMFLQIATIALLAFVLSEPFLTGGKEAQNYILVLDQSMSMQAKDEKPSRFDAAKERMKQFVLDASPNSNLSLIVLGSEPYLAVNNSSDKKTIINAISSISVTNSGVDIESFHSLLDLQREQTKSNVVIFTDSNNSLKDIGAEIVSFGGAAENFGVTLLSHISDQNGITALVKVKNFGQQSATRTVTLYQDEAIFDIQEISLAPGESKDVTFSGIDSEGKKLTARLTPNDLLEADDVCFDTVNSQKKQRALLFSERNIFVEKVLGILPNVEVIKGKTDEMENLNGYGLYIFDGVLPQQLPTDGHLLIFQPPIGNQFIKTEAAVSVSSINKGQSPLLQFISEIDFAVSNSNKLTLPEWGEMIFQSPETPLVVAGEIGSQKAVIFGFDLHQSDLPLSKEFPILMYNMIGWFFPSSVSGINKVSADSAVIFDISPEANLVEILNSEGKKIKLAPPFPLEAFTETNVPGIYTLEQKNAEGFTLSDSFAVNVVTEGESELSGMEELKEEILLQTGFRSGRSLKNLLLLLLLILLGAEWWVNCRDN